MLGLRRSEVCGYACVSPRIVMDRRPQSAMEMTMNVYGHVNLNSQRAALDHLDEQLSRRARCCRRRLSGTRSDHGSCP